MYVTVPSVGYGPIATRADKNVFSFDVNGNVPGGREEMTGVIVVSGQIPELDGAGCVVTHADAIVPAEAAYCK